MDYFKLTRAFWDFAFENPEKIKPNHCALYLFIVEHCNRLGWSISSNGEQSANNIEVKEPVSVVADSDDTGLPF